VTDQTSIALCYFASSRFLCIPDNEKHKEQPTKSPNILQQDNKSMALAEIKEEEQDIGAPFDEEPSILSDNGSDSASICFLLDQWQTNHHTFVGRRGQLMAP
jgi:hypothetical protein